MISKSIEKKQPTTFFILAGEQSADNHGAVLMQAIQAINPNMKFIGIGGKKMLKVGLKPIENIEKLAVMGFVEVIKHLFFFRELTSRVIEKIKSVQPSQIILIDYPGFNLHIAKKIKKRFDIPITYYISPQLWAWKEKRVEIIKKYIDQMLVIFPFEENWYRKRGVLAKFVGHPIFDEWIPTSKNDLCNLLRLNPDRPIFTLYPGSREQEIKYHLPILIAVAEKIRNKDPESQFIFGLAYELNLNNFSIPNWIQIENDHPQKALECADLALVASGTATIESAVFGTPMIIIYKMATLSWWLSKLLVKSDYAGMVNIISGKKIIPEFLQNQARVESITKEAFTIINSSDPNPMANKLPIIIMRAFSFMIQNNFHRG